MLRLIHFDQRARGFVDKIAAEARAPGSSKNSEIAAKAQVDTFERRDS